MKQVKYISYIQCGPFSKQQTLLEYLSLESVLSCESNVSVDGTTVRGRLCILLLHIAQDPMVGSTDLRGHTMLFIEL
jgi:hypothetical protein